MARPSKHDGVRLSTEVTARFGGCATGTVMVAAAWNQLTPKTGRKRSGNCANDYKPETKTRCTSFAGANSSRLANGWTFSWRTTPATHSRRGNPSGE